MAYASALDLLVLHSLRLTGFADDATVAHRFGLDRPTVEECLLDREAIGQVQRVGFADLAGWSLTEAGHGEHARLLAAELADSGARRQVADVHDRFTPLNARFLTVVTRWQIRPLPGDPLAVNDHSDWRWDERILDDLRSLLRAVTPSARELSEALGRFEGYPERLAMALERVDKGERSWVDRPRADSFHTVWFELHEDLLATLALSRGTA
jgi:hypothetical protein